MENKVSISSTRGAQISVIVPVYKVEPYLRTCIDSILNQTFRDFELILIDDGSPDNCGTICDEYAEKDSRVIVIHQENAGVAAARNAGLDWVFANSESEWITFVDSDDYIVPPYLEILYQAAVENDADVVNTYGHNFSDDSAVCKVPENVVSSRILSGRECCLSLYRWEGLIQTAPWGMLCRRNTLVSFRFPLGIAYGEDESFRVMLLYSCKRVVLLRSWLYGYRIRNSSAAHEQFTLNRYGHLRGIDLDIAYFCENGDHELANIARDRKQKYQVQYTLLAHRAGLTNQVPQEYRIPIVKAFWIELANTVREGGVKVFRRRIQTFSRLLKGKH